jgi:hypothetical protein
MFDRELPEPRSFVATAIESLQMQAETRQAKCACSRCIGSTQTTREGVVSVPGAGEYRRHTSAMSADFRTRRLRHCSTRRAVDRDSLPLKKLASATAA